MFNAVLADINRYADMAVNDEKAVKILQQRLSTIGTSELKSYEKEKRKLTKRLGELDRLFSALYEDRVMENITERNYSLMSAKYEKEQLQIDERLKAIEAELITNGKNDAGVVDFISLIKSYQGITELTATIVNTLIDKITVQERTKDKNGDVKQRITIYYKFVGSLNEFYILAPTPRQCILDSRVCEHCGATYTPKTGAAKYCPTCSKEVRKQQANDSKRKSRAKAKQNVA